MFGAGLIYLTKVDARVVYRPSAKRARASAGYMYNHMIDGAMVGGRPYMLANDMYVQLVLADTCLSKRAKRRLVLVAISALNQVQCPFVWGMGGTDIGGGCHQPLLFGDTSTSAAIPNPTSQCVVCYGELELVQATALAYHTQ